MRTPACGSPCGRGLQLTSVVAALHRAGHDVGGAAYARTPRGFTPTPAQDRLLRHWRALVPLHRWLEANVA